MLTVHTRLWPNRPNTKLNGPSPSLEKAQVNISAQPVIYSQRARHKVSSSSEQNDSASHHRTIPNIYTEVVPTGSLTKEPGDSHHGDAVSRITPLDVCQVEKALSMGF